jgi:hypothetical protein
MKKMIDPEKIETDEDLRRRLEELFADSPLNDEPLTDEQKAAVDRFMGREVPARPRRFR